MPVYGDRRFSAQKLALRPPILAPPSHRLPLPPHLVSYAPSPTACRVAMALTEHTCRIIGPRYGGHVVPRARSGRRHVTGAGAGVTARCLLTRLAMTPAVGEGGGTGMRRGVRHQS